MQGARPGGQRRASVARCTWRSSSQPLHASIAVCSLSIFAISASVSAPGSASCALTCVMHALQVRWPLQHSSHLLRKPGPRRLCQTHGKPLQYAATDGGDVRLPDGTHLLEVGDHGLDFVQRRPDVVVHCRPIVQCRLLSGR